MAHRVKLLICLVLLGFTACGVKAPPVPYLDVVAKEKAAEEEKLKKASPTPEPTPSPVVEQKKKKDSKKKK